MCWQPYGTLQKSLSFFIHFFSLGKKVSFATIWEIYANVLKPSLLVMWNHNLDQLEGLIWFSSSCTGLGFFKHVEFWLSIDIAWIHKTVHKKMPLSIIVTGRNGGTIDWAVFVCNVFYESFSVESVTIRQFARKTLMKSNRRKEQQCCAFGPLISVVARLLSN